MKITKKTIIGIIILACIAGGVAYFSAPLPPYQASAQLLESYKQVKTLGDAQNYAEAKKVLTDLKSKTQDEREQADIDVKTAMIIALEAVNTRQESTLLDQARALIAPLLLKYQDPELYYTAGYIEELGGNYSKAGEFYILALGLDTNNAKYLFQNGHNFELAGNFAEAKTWYEKALQADPSYSLAQVAVAKLSWRSGKSLDAIASFEALAEKLTDSRSKAEAYANISDMISRSQSGEEANARALEFANKSVATDKEFPFAYVVQAQALLKNKKIDEAYSAAMTAVFLNHNQAAAYLLLAEAQFAKGEFNAAIDNIRTFDAIVDRDITIMPKDRAHWHAEGLSKKLVYLLTIRSVADTAPLFAAEKFLSLDVEIRQTIKELNNTKNQESMFAALSIVLGNPDLQKLLAGDLEWASFELGFTDQDPKDMPKELANLPQRVEAETSLVNSQALADHQATVEKARKAQEKTKKDELRAKLERQLLLAQNLFVKNVDEAKEFLSDDEVKIYGKIVEYLAMPENKPFAPQTDESKAKREKTLEEIQNFIAKTFDSNRSTEMYGLMADFLEKFGNKESAYDYMKKAHEAEPANIRYVARLIQLSTDAQEQAQLRESLAKLIPANAEEEWLIASALDMTDALSESVLLATEKKLSEEMKPAYYRLMSSFYSTQKNTQKEEEYKTRELDFFFTK